MDFLKIPTVDFHGNPQILCKFADFSEIHEFPVDSGINLLEKHKTARSK